MVDFSDVVVVSNSRAEDGPLESVIKAMPGCSVSRFVSDGMSPDVAVARAMTFFTVVYKSSNPKLVVVLGDRYETLAAALAAMFIGIPVAHIHGGETTTGAFDNAMRHSISHMATLHFVATDDFSSKLKGMGIDPDSITVSGAPGLDGVGGDTARRDTKEMLVTYHPETRLPDRGVGQCEQMLAALSTWYTAGYNILFTGVNNDPGGEEIGELIQIFCEQRPFAKVVKTLSHSEYIQAMQRASLVVGNSSAGVIEAPWVGVPSINIGNRQLGRPMAQSVFGSVDDIEYALTLSNGWNPIYQGGAADVISASILKWLNEN